MLARTWTDSPALDLADATNKVGAPSFAVLARAGARLPFSNRCTCSGHDMAGHDKPVTLARLTPGSTGIDPALAEN